MSYKNGELPRRANHQQRPPKRDRLINYMKELIDDEQSLKMLTHNRLQRIATLFELPECVFNECKHEVFRYGKKVEAIKASLKVARAM